MCLKLNPHSCHQHCREQMQREALLTTSYSPASSNNLLPTQPGPGTRGTPRSPGNIWAFREWGKEGKGSSEVKREFRDRSGCGEPGCGTRGRAEPAAPSSPGRPHYPRLLPSAGARPGPGSGWLWLRRSRHVAQQDAAAPAAAPQTKPPRKRRCRGKAAMAAAEGSEGKRREGAGAAPQRPLTAQP